MTCDACDRPIRPWQHFGFVTRADGRRVAWHADCGRLMARPGVGPRFYVGLAVSVAIEAIVFIGLVLVIIYGLPIVAIATGAVR